MIELEQRGIATVGIVARDFEKDSAVSAKNFGLRDLAVAVAAEGFTSHAPDEIRAMVNAIIGEVERGLTEPPAERSGRSITRFVEDWLEFDGADALDALDAMNERYIEYGWSDGFPLVPATPDRLDRMLAGTARPADDVVAVLEPGFGIATVSRIAANAVMAGCRPEHLPVVIAAIECLADPRINLRGKAMSTGPQAPLLIVNGPIVAEIGLNSGRNALGPGPASRANTAIGRAVRLCMMNLGHTYHDIADMDTIGSPTKYSMCVAENVAASPWPPYSVAKGFPAEASTVTVQFVYGICELHDFDNHEPEKLAQVFAGAALNVAQVSTGHWLVGHRADARAGTKEKEHHVVMVCPEHAQIFKNAGWSRRRLQEELFRLARLPFRSLMINKEPRAMLAARPDLAWLWDSPETMLPVVEDPDCYEIMVVGATAGRGAFFWGAGGPVTKAIER